MNVPLTVSPDSIRFASLGDTVRLKPLAFGITGDTLPIVAPTWRSLDEFSNRYCPVTVPEARGIRGCDPTAVGLGNGSEWEIRTYLHLSI